MLGILLWSFGFIAVWTTPVIASEDHVQHHQTAGHVQHSLHHLAHSLHMFSMMDHDAHTMASHDGDVSHAAHHEHESVRSPLYGFSIHAGSPDVGYTDRTHSIYFENGLHIQRTKWGLDAALPMIVRHSDSAPLKGRGVGDLHLRGGFTPFRSISGLPTVTVGIIAKVPLAGVNQGFGTGRWDGGGYVSLAHGSRRMHFTAEAAYLAVGDPPGVDYRNPIMFSGGVGIGLTPRLGMFVQYAASTSWSDDLAAPKQLSGGFQWKLKDRISIFSHGTLGMSSSVPDLNLSFGILGPL